MVGMDTYKRVAPPISFIFYCSATHVTSQVLQPKTVNKRYRGQHTFISVHYTHLDECKQMSLPTENNFVGLVPRLLLK